MTDLDQFSVVALAIAVSYGMGVLWYSVLGHRYDSWMRTAALPLVGLFVAEGIWDTYTLGGPQFMGLHVVAISLGSGIAALVDSMIPALTREFHVARVVGVLSHLIR